MGNNNGTSINTGTENGLSLFCPLPRATLLFWTMSVLLLLSLLLNFCCCISKCSSGKWTCQRQKKQKRNPRQMEENPIYGNLGYMLTNTALYADVPLQANSDSQYKSQDCYANLTLKPARLQPGCSSSQIQFSDEVLVEEPLESEKDDEPCTDAASTLSDLYASVQTQRTKTIHPADSGEEYANHL